MIASLPFHSLWLQLTPLWVLLGIVLIFLAFVGLARIQGGRYVRPIVATFAKVPLFQRLMTKASEAAIERQDPDLAAAIKKLKRFGNLADQRTAQRALSTLTPDERRAYLAASGQQQEQMQQPLNREQRRRLEKARRDSERRR